MDLKWFSPEKTQQDFIDCFYKESVYAGGVGSGKTLSGAFKSLMVSHAFPGTVGLVGRQSYRALEDTTKKVMVYGDDKPAVIPPELVSSFNETDNVWNLKCGSQILFRSLEDHNIEKLLSLNLGWVYVDELTETTLRVWMTLLGRLRHPVGPRIAWGTTNPNGHDWVWKRWHPEANPNLGSKMLYIQPTHANAAHLAPDYISMLEEMPEEWKKRFVYASFEYAAGMIWDEFRREAHVFDADVVPRFPPVWTRFEAMDHGRRVATAWLWFVADPEGNIIVEDEYYLAGALPSQHAIAVSTKREMVAPSIRYNPAIAGPDVFRQDHNGRTVADEYMAVAGIPLQPANDNVQAGIIRVAEWMKRDPERPFPAWHPWGGTFGPDALGAPRVFISSKCANLITEIPDYRWKDLSPTAEKDKDHPEEPRKKDDHACDAFRYGIMSRARPKRERGPEDLEKIERRRQLRRGISAGIRDRVF